MVKNKNNLKKVALGSAVAFTVFTPLIISTTIKKNNEEKLLNSDIRAGETTVVTGGPLTGVDKFYASSLAENQQTIKNQIIFNNKISNVSGMLTPADIDFSDSSYDDALGELTVTITVKNNKAMQDGVQVSQLTLSPVTFSGFMRDETLLTTTFTGGVISNFDNILPSTVQPDNVELINQIIPLIKNQVSGTTITPSDVNLSIRSFNNLNGSIVVQVTVNNSKVWINGTPSDSWTFNPQTITGFKTQSPTNQVSYVSNVGISTITPSNYYSGTSDNQKLQELIFSDIDNILQNLPSDFSVNDINISSVNVYNPSGQLVVDFTISKYFDANGVPINGESSFSANLTINKFKADNTSTLVEGGSLDGVDSFFASDWEANQEAIKQAIIDGNKITNLYNLNITTSDIQFSNASFDNSRGTLTTNVTILNSRAQTAGYPATSLNFNNIKFSGFMIDQTLITTTFTGGEIEDFSSMPPSSVQSTDVKFINQVINLIKYPADSQKINNSDVQINIISYDNLNGSLVVSVTVNNSKVWIDGVIQETYTFSEQTITGFATQGPTNFLNVESVSVNQSQTKPSFYYSGDNSKIVNTIFNNRNTLFENLPTSFSTENIIINKVTPSNPDGNIKVSFSIKGYYDNQGVMTDVPSVEYAITITGFLKDSTSTTVKDGQLNSVSNIKPSEWQMNYNAIINAIINNKMIDNLYSNDIEASDVEITFISFDNEKGTLTLTVTIKNSKAQVNGEVKETWTSTPVTFSGFVLTKANGLTTVKIIAIILLFLGGAIIIGIVIWLVMKNRKSDDDGNQNNNIPTSQLQLLTYIDENGNEVTEYVDLNDPTINFDLSNVQQSTETNNYEFTNDVNNDTTTYYVDDSIQEQD